jgi:hypothetical protein
MRYRLFMQRSLLRSVTKQTPLSILLPCAEGEVPDGLANFDPNRCFSKLRLFKAEDLTLQKLRSREIKHFLECVALRDAYNRNDRFALQRSFEQLWPFITGQNQWKETALPAMTDRIQGELAKAFSTGSSARADWKSAELYLPQLVSKAIEKVRLVLWYSRQSQVFTPALYSPDLRTAIFLKALFGEIRTCPQCKRPFVPVNSNQDYCSLAHQAAYRVARWRAKKRKSTRPIQQRKAGN